MTDEALFVRVPQPQDVHVLVLQATKRSLEASADYIRLQKVRGQRAKLVKLLHEQATQMDESFTKLMKFFPEHELIDHAKKEPVAVKQDAASLRKQAAKVADSQADDKLAKINKALEDIEKKLGDVVL